MKARQNPTTVIKKLFFKSNGNYRTEKNKVTIIKNPLSGFKRRQANMRRENPCLQTVCTAEGRSRVNHTPRGLEDSVGIIGFQEGQQTERDWKSIGETWRRNPVIQQNLGGWGKRVASWSQFSKTLSKNKDSKGWRCDRAPQYKLGFQSLYLYLYISVSSKKQRLKTQHILQKAHIYKFKKLNEHQRNPYQNNYA